MKSTSILARVGTDVVSSFFYGAQASKSLFLSFANWLMDRFPLFLAGDLSGPLVGYASKLLTLCSYSTSFSSILSNCDSSCNPLNVPGWLIECRDEIGGSYFLKKFATAARDKNSWIFKISIQYNNSVCPPCSSACYLYSVFRHSLWHCSTCSRLGRSAL